MRLDDAAQDWEMSVEEFVFAAIEPQVSDGHPIAFESFSIYVTPSLQLLSKK
jgi:hypothetical protein